MNTCTQLLVITALLCFLGCKKEQPPQTVLQPPPEQSETPVTLFKGPINHVQLLKVDYLTYTFEGGASVTLSSTVTVGDTLPVAVTYTPPGDFGWVVFQMPHTSDTLFSGGIVWMGKGHIVFPGKFDSPATFSTTAAGTQAPPSAYVSIYFNGTFGSGYALDFTKSWNAIGGLKVIKDHLTKGRKIRVFLYTPSVGMGDPADWDWLFLL